jgi:hypothetical protein
MFDDDAFHIPDFLLLTAEQRRAAWERNPPKAMPTFGRAATETERLYRESIAHEKAIRRALDEPRFAAMRAKAAADKADRESVREAVRQTQRKRGRKERPGRKPPAGRLSGQNRDRHACKL